MTPRTRLIGLVRTALVAASLVLAPVAAANAEGGNMIFSTKKQCLYSQDQFHKVGYHIDYACYYTAGFWMFDYS